MNKQIEALKLALEGLEKWHFDKDPRGAADYIAAIREALAEQPAQQPYDTHAAPGQSFDTHGRTPPAQQQEPVAWILKPTMELLWPDEIEVKDPSKHRGYKPLYTSPQPSKPWVGLTDEEINILEECGEFWIQGTPLQFARAIEAKLRKKNA